MSDAAFDAPTETAAETATRVVPDRRTRRVVAYGVGAVDRANRLVLAVVGLVAVAAGVIGLLLAAGTVTWSETPATIYHRAAIDAIGAPDESAAIASAGCLVLAVLALWWVRAQVRPVGDGPKLTTLRLGTNDRGRTTVPAVAVANAAGEDFGRLFGVLSADVRLLATYPRPRAVVSLELGLDADPTDVLRAARRPLENLGTALGAEDVDAEFRLRFGKDLRSARGASRVR